MRLLKYNLFIYHVLRKNLTVINELSRLKEFSFYKLKDEEFLFTTLQTEQNSY